MVAGSFLREVDKAERDASELTTLDLGAGNGGVAELLDDGGCGSLVGLDIVPEAREAAERERPDVYDDYLITNLLDLGDEDATRLEDHGFDSLICGQALGFGDIPPDAFWKALEFVDDDGLIAFTIKDEFFEQEDSGFADMTEKLLEQRGAEVLHQERFLHRMTVHGEELHYYSVVAGPSTN